LGRGWLSLAQGDPELNQVRYCGCQEIGAESGACRSPIPAQADHLFRAKPITDSEASRSLISAEAEQFWAGVGNPPGIP